MGESFLSSCRFKWNLFEPLCDYIAVIRGFLVNWKATRSYLHELAVESELKLPKIFPQDKKISFNH